MDGHGWCVDAEGGEGTARKFLMGTSYSIASSICNSDDKCAGFAYANDTRAAVVYTTTGCTTGCTNTAWTQNPTLITAASWCCDQTLYTNAVCFRKRSGKPTRQYF